MLLTTFLPLLLLPSLACAFDSTKWTKLAASSKDGVVKLDSAAYDELTAGPREFSVSVVLTAMPLDLKCEPCRTFQPNYHLVSSSWNRLPKTQRSDHIFASLDFPDGQDVYRRLGLTTAPTLQFFPATEGLHKPPKVVVDQYDFARFGFAPENLIAYLSKHLPHPLELHRPANYLPMIFTSFFLIFTGLTLIVAWPYVLPLVQRKEPWMFASLAAILIFTSGHMWNKIRNAPFATQQGWMAAGFSNQYGMETQLVGMLYGALALTVVILTHVIPSLKGAGRQQAAVMLWTATSVTLFGTLLQFFKWKNGGYPFTMI